MAFLERMTRLLVSFLCAIWGLAACGNGVESNHARVAVATNFKSVMDALETRFEAETPYEIETVTGATGGLYAQILQGAPFDVYLAADQTRPEKLEEAGYAITGTRFTYAIGQLVLWHPEAEPVDLDSLKNPKLRKLAIANPALAPYGKAAQSALDKLGLDAILQDRIVFGGNVGQAMAFVKTGNAELGIVARSQILSLPQAERGAHFLLDATLHAPIRQDAQLLKRGENNKAAKAFLAYLASDEAAEMIADHGYASR